MNKQSGVTIIECIIYLALCALGSFLVFRWWHHAQQQLKFLQSASSHAAQERCIYMVMARDIAHADAQHVSWSCTDDQIKCVTKIGVVTYQYKKGTLFRFIKKHGTTRTIRSTIARHLDPMSWKLVVAGIAVKSVQVDLKRSDGAKISWLLPVKRGMR